MDSHDPELKRELDATLHTRKELGPEYEDELIDSFLAKVEQRLDSVVETRVRRQLAEHQMSVARSGVRPQSDGRPQAYERGFSGFTGRLGLAVASLVFAIPLSAIAAANAHVPGLLVCWAGIVGVNAAQASRFWFDPGGGGKRTDGWDRD